jgi:hypothetical protein
MCNLRLSQECRPFWVLNIINIRTPFAIFLRIEVILTLKMGAESCSERSEIFTILAVYINHNTLQRVHELDFLGAVWSYTLEHTVYWLSKTEILCISSNHYCVYVWTGNLLKLQDNQNEALMILIVCLWTFHSYFDIQPWFSISYM